jgi:inorganic pyrophosphatase
MQQPVLVHPPERVDVIIDTPRFSPIKRRDDGSVEFVAPLPCPFNYGSVPDSVAADGDRIDVVVLGPRLARGVRVNLPVRGVARFIDAGIDDPKWICAERPLRALDRMQIDAFFRLYALVKRARNRLRGRHSVTRYDGLWLRDGSDRAS